MRGRRVGRRTRALAAGAALAFASAGPGTASAEPVSPTPAFVETPCAFPLSARQAVGFNVLCGRVGVPERHSAPEGRRIHLAVAVLRSPNPTGPPLVYLNGGPAGESGGLVPALVDRGLTLRRLLQARDVVVFDQRGVGRSTPPLSCAVETVIAPRGPLARALTDCAARLGRWGVDLGAYTTAENAADVAALATALGVATVDLYGSSYGSRLALTVMRDHPATVRSVILDAPVPVEADLAADLGVSFDRALRRVFAACSADRACARAYPRLEASLVRAYRRLNRRPVRVRPVDSETGTRGPEIQVDGDAFMDLVYLVVFAGAAQILPQVVDDAANGDDTLLRIVSTLADPSSAEDLSTHGMYLSVMCQEEFAFSSFARATARDARLLEPVRRANRQAVRRLFDACAAWPVGRTSEIETQPVRSALPTLILAGQFDPITPPEYAAQIARSLPNGIAVTVRGYGHGTVGLGPCPVAIVAAFLADPTATPDVRCAASVPFRFSLPRRGRPTPNPRPTESAATVRRGRRGSPVPVAFAGG
ncbi:MAG: hypothetical protein AVDCRST_MAG79-355 [uncultured Thermoleophilia bacterium]|uniref:Uncharacterized protein n=1 Tax=uncultured Thermoleophilia bacterium TaxID=1497501 RepID=A0A6J4THW9_9ACTN|nr:MAG: hypothetical protein AVDCRST_MAG79-355 [uncultured Thermoleophilia bacterium]